MLPDSVYAISLLAILNSRKKSREDMEISGGTSHLHKVNVEASNN
jgi:hypothetical protein